MERTDCYLDNLRVSLALWDKLLLLGGEVEGWVSRRLDSFIKQTQPFQSEQEVLRMQVQSPAMPPTGMLVLVSLVPHVTLALIIELKRKKEISEFFNAD